MGTDRYCTALINKENDISEWSINPYFDLALNLYLNRDCYLRLPRGNKYKFDDRTRLEINTYIFHNKGNVKPKKL